MARVWGVVVVGGGPAGCMTALTLHTLGHSVVVVDEKALGSDGLPPFRPSQYSGETISPSAMEILERLGVTLDYDGSPHLEWQGTRSIWSSADAVDQDFIFNKRGQRGWILHRTVFDQDLRKRVSETGIEIIASSSVRSASKPDEGLWALEVLQAPSPGEGDKEHEGHRLALSASWVVDATGRRASIARLMGFAPHKLDDLTAFVVHFEECGPSHNSRTCQHDRRVMIEASELGWWYSAHLPLVGGRCQRVVIFHTDSDHAAARQARQAAGFRELLQTSGQTIYQVLQRGGFDTDERRPACVSAASQLCWPPMRSDVCFVAVGDAAMAFDPLSSQGIQQALAGGVGAANCVSRVLTGQDASAADIFNTLCREEFERYVSERAYVYRSLPEDKAGDSFWQRRRGEATGPLPWLTDPEPATHETAT